MKAIFKKYPLTSRFILYLVLPLIVAAGCIGEYVRKSLPENDGVVFIEALHDKVDIAFDNYGIPSIHAESDWDAFFAVGYLHAQNRLWQMEYQRRLGQGRLSEVFGKATVRVDRFMRTLGLNRAAQDAASNLGSEERFSLEAYAEGVNAWIDAIEVFPPEFLLLGIEPEPWTVQDSLLQIKLMALNLDGNYQRDLEFNVLSRSIGRDRARKIMGHEVGPETSAAEVSQQSVTSLLRLSMAIDDAYQLGGEGVGSNAWVAAGRHTESGLPLLANDPHLKTQISTIWYMVKIRGDEFRATGATVPGLPIVLSGHNGTIAWGITALRADVQDLFLERISSDDESRYQVGDQWEEVEQVEETIHVKADFPSELTTDYKPLKMTVRSTRHGPLISDAIGRVDTPLALKWSALAEDDNTYGAYLSLNHARDWVEFNQALEQYGAPALNFLYADTQGNIGHVVGGRVPIRKSGKGIEVVEGWSGESDWVGYIPAHELPRSFNPASGYIVTANEKPHDANYPYFMSSDWAPGYRARRISELLDGRIKSNKALTVDDFREIQGDVKNTQAEDLLPLFLSVNPVSSQQERAISLLNEWDLVADRDSVGATIYHAWRRHFSLSLFSNAVPSTPLMPRRTQEISRIRQQIVPKFLKDVASGQLAQWCDLASTEQYESCLKIAGDSLQPALDEVAELAGNDVDRWQWGKVHTAQYPHSGFNEVRFLDWIFNRKQSKGGDIHTVNVAFTFYSKQEGYKQVTGANYRQIIDLAELANSVFVSDTGQSGNVLSTHYDDLMELHRDLQFLPMKLNSVGKSSRSLSLMPARNRNN